MPLSGEIITTGMAQTGSTPKRVWRTWFPQASNPAGSDGICKVILGPVPSGQSWLVEFARIQNNSSAASDLEVFRNDENNPLSSIDSAPGAGNDNSETFPSPGAWVGEGDKLIYVWSNADAGSVGTVNAQVKISQG